MRGFMFEPTGFGISIALAIMIAVSAFLTRVLVKFRLLAMPNVRSAHKQPVPTAGGLAVALVVVASASLFVQVTDIDLHLIPQLIGLAALAAVLGLVDDVVELSSGFKFGILFGLSVLMAIILGPVVSLPFDTFSLKIPWVLGVVGTALWVFTLTNTVNFMDGADGVVPLSALLVSLGLAVLAAFFGVWSACGAALFLAAGLAGFLPFNMPRARIFLGDTGSLFIGTWIAGTALILIAEGPPAVVWIMPLLTMPWLSDVLLTMFWRLGKKRKLLVAHNDHLYQLALAKGHSHLRVAIGLALQMVAVTVLAILFRVSPTSAFLGFASAASFAALVHWRARQQDRHH